MNSQESDSPGLRRFAGPVRLEASGKRSLPVVAGRSVNVGLRGFHHEKVAAQEALTSLVRLGCRDAFPDSFYGVNSFCHHLKRRLCLL